MRNAGLEEAQAGSRIAGRNISNLRYADDTTLMAESEEEHPGAVSRAEKALSFEGYVSRGVCVLTVHYPAHLFFIYCCFLFYWSIIVLDLVAQSVKICLKCRIPRFDPWDGNIPWRREWLPTPVFLPRKSPGQRSLVGYSPWGHKELDTTEQLTNSLFIIALQH